MGYSKDQLLAHLQELQIDFITYEHPVVLTVEAQAKYLEHLRRGLSKNLLLKDKKHRYYVISALAGTNVDLKVLSQRLGLGKGGIRMAPEEALTDILQVPTGCVTPFALINESARAVSLLLDQAFKAQECCFFHPLSNDSTISLNTSNLDKFLLSIGKNPSYVNLEADTVVGKDNPPDLAGFVPAEVPQLPEQTVKAALIHVPEPKHAPLEKKITLVQERDCQSSHGPQKATDKPSRTGHALADATDVRKFIKELIKKTSSAVLSEISKELKDGLREPVKSAVLDGVKMHISPDLENIAMILKNAAYAQGIQAGIKSHSYAERNYKSSQGPQKARTKPSRTGDALAEATDVGKFIKELIEKTSSAVLSEISKELKDGLREPVESAVLDGVEKRISPDLENLAMIMKNAAYTQGFHAGIKSLPAQVV